MQYQSKKAAIDGHRTLPSRRWVVSNKKVDGLEINGPVKGTVGAIDEPSPINTKQQRERGLESNGNLKVEK